MASWAFRWKTTHTANAYDAGTQQLVLFLCLWHGGT